MSIFDPKADTAAIAPEIDKSVASLENALSTLFDGYQIVVQSDDGTAALTAKRLIVKITKVSK